MDKKDVPLGFGFALVRHPGAMHNFSLLPEAERSAILQKARSVSSKDEMQRLVMSLVEPKNPDT